MNLFQKLLAVVLVVLPSSLLADLKLYMAEEDGCLWCARWHDEIGAIYPKTAEGRTAPLVVYNLHDEKLTDVTLSKTVHFTPTFILVQDGTEVGRIEGYPGEDFFWGLLGMVFSDAKIQLDETS